VGVIVLNGSLVGQIAHLLLILYDLGDVHDVHQGQVQQILFRVLLRYLIDRAYLELKEPNMIV